MNRLYYTMKVGLPFILAVMKTNATPHLQEPAKLAFSMPSLLEQNKWVIDNDNHVRYAVRSIIPNAESGDGNLKDADAEAEADALNGYWHPEMEIKQTSSLRRQSVHLTLVGLRDGL